MKLGLKITLIATLASSLALAQYIPQNQRSSTLTAGISATDTTIPVASGATFPAPTFVTIDNEVISVCQTSGNNLIAGTLAACPSALGRGADHSVAAAHLANAQAAGRIVAGYLMTSSAGSGFVPRPVQDKVGDTISVLDYGAKCDAPAVGLSSQGTDDTAAFQAAIYAVSTSGDQQRTVEVPQRTCRIAGSLKLPYGVSLKGQGEWKSKLVFDSNPTGIVIQTTPSTYAFPPIVEDLTLSCANYCIDTNGVNGFILRNVWATAYEVLLVNGTADIWVDHLVVDGGSNGIQLKPGAFANNIRITNSYFSESGAGVILADARDVLIEGCTFRGNAGYNILFDSSSTSFMTSVLIHNNTFYDSGTGTYTDIMMYSPVKDVQITGNHFEGANNSAIYIPVNAGGSPDGVLISDNIFKSISGPAIQQAAGTHVKITNNIFRDLQNSAVFGNSTGGTTDISGNLIMNANLSNTSGTGGSAVVFSSGASVAFLNNTITGSAHTYGFSTNGSVASTTVSGNTISGSTVSNYNNNAVAKAVQNQQGNSISFGGTTPTASCSIGDIVYRDNPLAGRELGWICTAANTWTSFGTTEVLWATNTNPSNAIVRAFSAPGQTADLVDLYNNDGSALLFFVDKTGLVGAPSGYSVAGSVGFTGAKTVGACVLTIKGGIITAVTGC